MFFPEACIYIHNIKWFHNIPYTIIYLQNPNPVDKMRRVGGFISGTSPFNRRCKFWTLQSEGQDLRTLQFVSLILPKKTDYLVWQEILIQWVKPVRPGYKYQADTMPSFYEVAESKVIETGFDPRAVPELQEVSMIKKQPTTNRFAVFLRHVFGLAPQPVCVYPDLPLICYGFPRLRNSFRLVWSLSLKVSLMMCPGTPQQGRCDMTTSCAHSLIQDRKNFGRIHHPCLFVLVTGPGGNTVYYMFFLFVYFGMEGYAVMPLNVRYQKCWRPQN